MSDKTYTIERFTGDAGRLAVCARMMAGSMPWKALYFTEKKCLADLSSSSLEIYGLLDGKGEVACFLASMAHGVGFEPMISYLCTRKETSEQGMDEAMARHFEETLFPDADNLYVFVPDIDHDAIKLYMKRGYQPIAVLTDYNLAGQNVFLHRKMRRPRQEQAMIEQMALI
jgi:ribosomal protein S18 acetylase RimI-like enzyme